MLYEYKVKLSLNNEGEIIEIDVRTSFNNKIFFCKLFKPYKSR